LEGLITVRATDLVHRHVKTPTSPFAARDTMFISTYMATVIRLRSSSCDAGYAYHYYDAIRLLKGEKE
jgi:hypothetical protein